MKSYTDVEQSKKLIELGIDTSSADMCYDVGKGEEKAHIECDNFISYFTNDEYPEMADRYIPCWSLTALLDILPKSEDKAFDLSYGHYGNDTYIPKWYISYIDNSKNIPFIKMIDGDNLIDIVVQLLMYLKANEQI